MEIMNKKIEDLSVYVCNNREELGKAAAHSAAEKINEIIEKNGVANIVFAAAPSQPAVFTPDLIFLGIGENGHLAFNDPSVADFHDTEMIKVVELEDVCRQQQVNDGCFKCFEDVPQKAITMTMSFIQSVPLAICCVPTERKANAVKNALYGPISETCPASILRKLPNAELYLDKNSASLIL